MAAESDGLPAVLLTDASMSTELKPRSTKAFEHYPCHPGRREAFRCLAEILECVDLRKFGNSAEAERTPLHESLATADTIALVLSFSLPSVVSAGSGSEEPGWRIANASCLTVTEISV